MFDIMQLIQSKECRQEFSSLRNSRSRAYCTAMRPFNVLRRATNQYISIRSRKQRHNFMSEEQNVTAAELLYLQSIAGVLQILYNCRSQFNPYSTPKKGRSYSKPLACSVLFLLFFSSIKITSILLLRMR